MVITDSAPLEGLKAAMIKDGEPNVTDSHPHLQPNRGHLEVNKPLATKKSHAKLYS